MPVRALRLRRLRSGGSAVIQDKYDGLNDGHGANPPGFLAENTGSLASWPLTCCPSRGVGGATDPAQCNGQDAKVHHDGIAGCNVVRQNCNMLAGEARCVVIVPTHQIYHE